MALGKHISCRLIRRQVTSVGPKLLSAVPLVPDAAYRRILVAKVLRMMLDSLVSTSVLNADVLRFPTAACICASSQRSQLFPPSLQYPRD